MLYLQLFDRRHVNRSPVTGVTVPRDLSHLKRLYIHNKDVIVKYYQDKNFAVKNTHILSRLVEQFSLLLEDSFSSFTDYVRDNNDHLVRNYKITSGYEKGLIHPPYFYANGGSEILLLETSYFDEEAFRRNWKNEVIVRTLLHPRNDLRLMLPTGNDDRSKGGLATIAIDIYKLNIAYREFIIEQTQNLTNGSTVYTKNNFIMKYILPNMIESDIDHRFLNRIMDTYYEEPIMTPMYKHRFQIYEPEMQMQRYVKDVLSVITSKKMNFANIMFNIPLIFRVNAADLLAYDNIPNTIQSNWAFVASRLRFFCFLYDVSLNKGMSSNYIADWKLMVKRLESDGSFWSGLYGDESVKLRGYIEKIKAM